MSNVISTAKAIELLDGKLRSMHPSSLEELLESYVGDFTVAGSDKHQEQDGAQENAQGEPVLNVQEISEEAVEQLKSLYQAVETMHHQQYVDIKNVKTMSSPMLWTLNKSLSEIASLIHRNSMGKGFYDGTTNIGEKLALIHSEVSEALEADREGRYNGAFVDGPTAESLINETDSSKLKAGYEEFFKGTFEDELADVIIRVLDLCAYKGISIGNYILLKHRYNTTREKFHGKKY